MSYCSQDNCNRIRHGAEPSKCWLFLLSKVSPVPEHGFLLALWKGFYHLGIERTQGLSTRRLYLNLPQFHLFFSPKAATLESS